MSKALVETTGSFMLVDPFTRNVVEFNRPCVVEWSSFIEQRVGLKQLRLLGSNLTEGGTDEEFQAYLKEVPEPEKLEFAVSAFLEAFTVREEVGDKSEVTSPVADPAEKIKPATKTKE